jgi:hypothetical protein
MSSLSALLFLILSFIHSQIDISIQQHSFLMKSNLHICSWECRYMWCQHTCSERLSASQSHIASLDLLVCTLSIDSRRLSWESVSNLCMPSLAKGLSFNLQTGVLMLVQVLDVTVFDIAKSVIL